MRLALIPAVLLILTACPPLPVEEGQSDGLRTLSAEGVSDSGGIATFVLDSLPAEDALLATVQAESPFLAFVNKVTDPGGNVVLEAESLWDDSEHNLTSGAYPDGVSNLNWPIDEEGSLDEGSWTVEVGVLDDELFYVRDADVTLDAQLKQDDAFDEGGLKVEIVYIGDVIGDQDLISAVEGGVGYWVDLYATMGITIEVEYWEYADAADLPAPGSGARSDYIAIADSTSFRSVKVLLTSEIRDGTGLYGFAGGIPGPLLATGNTGVTISAAMNAGPDLVFSEEEVRLLGETMAHEVGHFTGLFHPVESSFVAWDAVSDTPECDGEATCIDRLGSNLMFPYPVCYSDGCPPQDELTDGQAAIANRYTGTK